MNEHLHSTFVEGCFRCELGRDEVDEAAAEHERMCNEGCPVCGAVGPCGFTDAGEPLICASPEERETR